jgi:hypothetical protein
LHQRCLRYPSGRCRDNPQLLLSTKPIFVALASDAKQ